MVKPILEIRGLSVGVDHGMRPVVRNVSMTLTQGRTLAVVGESGSGKTMTAMAVLRLLPRGAAITGGQVLYHGREPATDLLRLGRCAMQAVRGGEIACVFQEPAAALNPVFTIGEQIDEVLQVRCALSRRAARSRTHELLAEVGIDDVCRRADQYPHQFSGGMRQRALIALALGASPKVLLADEPTSALDAEHRLRILDLLTSLSASRRLSMMLITHDLGLVRRHAHDVAVMYAGRVIERGPAPDVLSNPRHPYTRALLRCAPGSAEPRTRLTTITDVLTEPGSLELPMGKRAWWVEASDAEPTYVEVGAGHAVAVNETSPN